MHPDRAVDVEQRTALTGHDLDPVVQQDGDVSTRPHAQAQRARARAHDREWLVGPQIAPDADCTHGELDFETMAALFSLAEVVFCPPGFATILAQATGTRCITVFGGYEDARSFAGGAKHAPWLPIEPLVPCPCWSADCPGDKTIDLFAAMTRIEEFLQ